MSIYMSILYIYLYFYNICIYIYYYPKNLTPSPKNLAMTPKNLAIPVKKFDTKNQKIWPEVSKNLGNFQPNFLVRYIITFKPNFAKKFDTQKNFQPKNLGQIEPNFLTPKFHFHFRAKLLLD